MLHLSGSLCQQINKQLSVGQLAVPWNRHKRVQVKFKARIKQHITACRKTIENWAYWIKMTHKQKKTLITAQPKVAQENPKNTHTEKKTIREQETNI